MHRKHGKLMQIGGHIELNETPWQTLAHEISEESGIALDDLYVLQPFDSVPTFAGAASHPIAPISNTHYVGEHHYHSDYGLAFMTKGDPDLQPAEGESADLRWLTRSELAQAALTGLALQDVADIYTYLIDRIVPSWHKVDATAFTIDRPAESLLKK